MVVRGGHGGVLIIPCQGRILIVDTVRIEVAKQTITQSLAQVGRTVTIPQSNPTPAFWVVVLD
jgi:hypothetical protein